MNNMVPCKVCHHEVESVDRDGSRDITLYLCPVCGEFGMTRSAAMDLERMSNEDRAKVSAYLRERTLRQDPMVTLLSGSHTGSIDIPAVAIKDVLDSGFPQSLADRLDRALNNLYRMSTHLGAEIRLDDRKDYPLLFAENADAFKFIAETLQAAGWLKLHPMFGPTQVVVTAKGLDRIAELGRNKAWKESKQAFVAMWFDSSLDKAWDAGFKKACGTSGYDARRMDLVEHNQKICDAIIAEIRRSRFVVADFTGHRGGVYFEAGYALGLGIPVIWTCQKDDLEKTHFDTRQYNHIAWENEEDLFVRLKNRIEATIPS